MCKYFVEICNSSISRTKIQNNPICVNFWIFFIGVRLELSYDACTCPDTSPNKGAIARLKFSVLQ